MRGTRTQRTEQARADLCRRCAHLNTCEMREATKHAMQCDVINIKSCSAYAPAKELE